MTVPRQRAATRGWREQAEAEPDEDDPEGGEGEVVDQVVVDRADVVQVEEGVEDDLVHEVEHAEAGEDTADGEPVPIGRRIWWSTMPSTSPPRPNPNTDLARAGGGAKRSNASVRCPGRGRRTHLAGP